MVKCLSCNSENLEEYAPDKFRCLECGATFSRLLSDKQKGTWTPLGINGQLPPMTHNQRWNLVRKMRRG